MLSKCQAGARDRSTSWNLAEDDFRRLASLGCHYYGAAPATVRRTAQYSKGHVYNPSAADTAGSSPDARAVTVTLATLFTFVLAVIPYPLTCHDSLPIRGDAATTAHPA